MNLGIGFTLIRIQLNLRCNSISVAPELCCCFSRDFHSFGCCFLSPGAKGRKNRLEITRRRWPGYWTLAKRNATIATTATLRQQTRRRGEILEQKWLKVKPAADGSGVQIFFLFSFPYFRHFQCHGPCGNNNNNNPAKWRQLILVGKDRWNCLMSGFSFITSAAC